MTDTATLSQAAPGSTGADYRVELEAYSGPLDLLLYLVKRHEIDLHDIPIAQLTDQYLQHVRLIKEIDVNLAGEFLVMAATLLEIKSQMIIPAAPVEQKEGEAEASGGEAQDALSTLDPRFELVQQLLAYKRFKDAAGELDERWEDWHARFAARPKKAAVDENQPEGSEPVEIDLEDVSILDLCEAFSRMLESIGQKRDHQVKYDDTPIELHAADIVDRLQREGSGGQMTLQQFFVGRESRSELIGLFLATLELVKQRRIRVLQDKVAGEISLALVPEDELAKIVEREDAGADWRDPQTGEVQYDWPDPDAKARAESRAKRRGERLAKIRRGEKVEPDEDEIDAIEIEAIDDIDRKLRAISEDGKPATKTDDAAS